MNKFYVTAAIPYVNAAPHIGHALEFVQTDVIARFQELLGKETLMLSGGDENALKNVQAAEKVGVPIQKFVDTNTDIFFELTKELNTRFDIWQKGSNKGKHFPSSQELWKRCEAAGDIYKKRYEGLYCVGCEIFYSKEELDEKGECPEHPGKKLQKVAEENYFFKLSKYEKQLIELIEKDKLEIVPTSKKNEMLSFLKKGLNDISISRTNERAKNWGVPVPNDPNQRIYVWFDALNIYQSGVGFGWDEKKYKKWWPANVHVIGKGITRFHAIYWPAFLLSAKLKLPKTIFVHGYFTVEGQKISKTIGNVIDPSYLIKKYGADALRYYFLAKFNPFTDGDFSEKKLVHAYNSDLANGLGNLIARVAKLCEKTELSFDKTRPQLYSGVKKAFDQYRFDRALESIWDNIRKLDKEIEKDRPWEKEGADLNKCLEKYVPIIRNVAFNLRPFLPKTAEAIEKQFAGPKIKAGKPLFPRLSEI